jgi:GAF domain-containing protein
VAALETGGEVIGTLSLYDKKSADLAGSRSYSESDREVMVNFARQAAAGLERFRPFPAPASWQPAPAGAG